MRTIVEIANDVEREMEGRSLHMLAVRVASITHDEVTHEFWRKLNAMREKLIQQHNAAKKWAEDAKQRYGTTMGFGYDMWEETDEERHRRYDIENAYKNAEARVTAIESQWGAIVEAFGKDVTDAAWAWKQEQEANKV